MGTILRVMVGLIIFGFSLIHRILSRPPVSGSDTRISRSGSFQVSVNVWNIPNPYTVPNSVLHIHSVTINETSLYIDSLSVSSNPTETSHIKRADKSGISGTLSVL
jgi:hypothetical protein